MAPPRDEDDWSDSDEEDLVDVETSVLLGVPDGSVDADDDLNDVAVSRIGGRPAFLTATEPPLSSSECKNCQRSMELLVQMWSPFEDSPMDRALYIWGCPRVGCQGKQGTVRAWRGLRFNEEYAIKLQRKLERQKARENAKKPPQPVLSKTNPFSSNATSAAPNPFGLGAQIFGNPIAPQPEPAKVDATDAGEDEDSDSGNDSDCSEESLLTAMASVAISESAWKPCPSYPAYYLSTASEWLPGQPKPKVPDSAEVVEVASKDTSWMSEAYEDSLDTDHVFDRFSQRVEAEPEQCVRYELKGTPLPFASDAVFDKLFPAPVAAPPAITKAAAAPAPKRTFDPSTIPACPACRSKRVFECQLMPNLINVLRPKEKAAPQTDEDRRKAVEEALKKGNKDDRRTMEWGTAMVFSCENDCCLDADNKEAKYTWREEEVLLQWDV